MACFIERYLKDKETEQFLTSKGFILVPHTVHSTWLKSGVVTIHLNDDVKIHSDDTLISVIIQQSFDEGYRLGRNDCLSIISKRINDLIFHPLTEGYKEKSYN